MICPSCGLNVKKAQQHSNYKSLNVYFFQCPNCEHLFAGTHDRHSVKAIPPDTFIAENFPASVQQVSPEAFRIYCDTLKAKSFQLIEFAGIGLRKALENLLSDYLIKWKHLPENELPKTLKGKADKIYALNNYLYADICMRIVRTFGNDSAHIKTKFPTLNFTDALLAFETLCKIMDAEFHLAQLNASILSTP